MRERMESLSAEERRILGIGGVALTVLLWVALAWGEASLLVGAVVVAALCAGAIAMQRRWGAAGRDDLDL